MAACGVSGFNEIHGVVWGGLMEKYQEGLGGVF
jgi:hypothetical protein